MNPVLSRTLIYLGWSLFGVALFCPGDEFLGNTLVGWKCLLASLCVWPVWIVRPVAVFGLTNLAFFFGALVYSWGGGLERKTYGVFLGLAAVIATAVMLVAWEGAREGAYLWLGALSVTALGFYLADPPEGERRAQSPT